MTEITWAMTEITWAMTEITWGNDGNHMGQWRKSHEQ